jgi:SPRY domain
VYIGAYAIDDDPSIFRLVIASIVDIESFFIHCQQLDSATRDYLVTRLDYYQVDTVISLEYRADSTLIVTNSLTNITASKCIDDNCESGLIWDASIHKYAVTVNASCNMAIEIGFAPSKLFDVSKDNSRSCGWYLYLCRGTLHAQNGDEGKAYSSECEVGDTITCIYNASTSEIFFEKNGVPQGVAYTNISGEEIAPAVQLYYEGDSITLSTD